MKRTGRLNEEPDSLGRFFKPEGPRLKIVPALGGSAGPACLPADLRFALLDMPFQPGLPSLETLLRDGLIVDRRAYLGLLPELE